MLSLKESAVVSRGGGGTQLSFSNRGGCERTTEGYRMQTMQDMLSESAQCNDMVADLHFPQFFGTAIQCEIARRFPRSVVKVGLNVKCKKYQYFQWGSTLNLDGFDISIF